MLKFFTEVFNNRIFEFVAFFIRKKKKKKKIIQISLRS